MKELHNQPFTLKQFLIRNAGTQSGQKVQNFVVSFEHDFKNNKLERFANKSFTPTTFVTKWHYECFNGDDEGVADVSMVGCTVNIFTSNNLSFLLINNYFIGKLLL